MELAAERMSDDRRDRIPELLARLDVHELVVRLGGVESNRPGTYHCPHPRHEDRTPSFTVRDGRWKCWSVCATGGDAIDLLVWLNGQTKAEAIDELAAMVGLDRHEFRAAFGTQVLNGGSPATSKVPTGTSDTHRLVQWCAGRGWGPHVVEALELSVVADDYGRPRTRFPFRLAGAVPYHQDRAMGDAVTLRWLSPKGARPIPYEADRMGLADDRGHVFIVEGVTDVAALVDVYTAPAVVGVPGVEAWRQTWAAAFRGLDVYVIADNDKAGGTFRSKLTADLSPVVRGVWHVLVPESHSDVASWRRHLDPGRFDDEMMAAVEASAGHRVEIAA